MESSPADVWCDKSTAQWSDACAMLDLWWPADNLPKLTIFIPGAQPGSRAATLGLCSYYGRDCSQQ